MKKYMKFGVIAIAAILALTAGITAVAFAQSPEGEANSDGGPGQVFISKVAGILGLDEEQVADAFAQARSEMMNEAQDRHLQNLVDEGVITQEEADQYQEWWQARPDIPLLGPLGGGMGRGCWGGPPPPPEASE